MWLYVHIGVILKSLASTMRTLYIHCTLHFLLTYINEYGYHIVHIVHTDEILYKHFDLTLVHT